MSSCKRIPIEAESLSLPDSLLKWVHGSPLYAIGGYSEAATIFVERPLSPKGAFLKVSVAGTLRVAARMHTFLSTHGLAPRVIDYVSEDRDYLLVEALRGIDGTGWLAFPQRLCVVFGRSLRRLHEVPLDGCPVGDVMTNLLARARTAEFCQSDLDVLAPFIGPSNAQMVGAEIKALAPVVQCDSVIHGDYCLPNIILDDFSLVGFIDLGDSGIGDRHLDLVTGLWTLNFNLKTSEYGSAFLDAYGLDRIDGQRLRVCGLLSAMIL
jgi:kanamycin kinase